MTAVLDLLKASDDPNTDRRLFLKAQIIFWLLGATDGHAKNFSIFLQPGSRFRLAPLYDVMSVQPALDAGELRKNQMKFAMAVGHNRHYLVYEIMPRHFTETAAKSGVPSSFVQSIFGELVGSADTVINQVMNELPDGFPQELAESIVGGLRARLRLVDASMRAALSNAFVLRSVAPTAKPVQAVRVKMPDRSPSSAFLIKLPSHDPEFRIV